MLAVVKTVAYLGYLLAALIVLSFLSFLVIDSIPELRSSPQLQRFAYFRAQQRFEPHPTLVYAPQPRPAELNLPQRSWDQWRPGMGGAGAGGPYVASYSASGFRTNSSPPPFELALVGDSFIEIGETDNDTLSEFLSRNHGLSTANFGRGGYGPYQYLEVTRLFVTPQKPKRVVFCLYTGNDLWELLQYEQWLHGGKYGHSHYDGNPFRRFKNAFLPELKVAFGVRSRLSRFFPSVVQNRGTGETKLEYFEAFPDVASVGLQTDSVQHQTSRMYFSFFGDTRPVAEKRTAPEYQTLTTILKQFKALATEADGEAWLLIIPTKDEIYAQQIIVEESGSIVQQKLPAQLASNDSTREVLATIGETIGLSVLDLTPGLRRAAIRAPILYEPFDSHWNIQGRTVAAELIAQHFVGDQQSKNEKNAAGSD